METDEPSALLGEMVEQRTEKVVLGKDLSRPYIGLEHMASNSPDLVGSARADTSVSTNSIFERDDILFGKLRPNLKKCVLAPFPGYCSTDVIVLRARYGVVPAFAAKVLQSDLVFSQAVKTAVGTKMPRTSWGSLAALRVFCPVDQEQHRIAAILDTLDDAIRRTAQVIAKLQQMKQGLLFDLLTRGVDENGDLRPLPERAPHLYKDSPLGRIPKVWEVSDGRSLCREVVVGIVIRPTQYYRGEGVPVLRSANIREDRLDPTDLVFMSRRDHLAMSKSAVSPGDVITVRTGYPGTTCVVPESMPEANCVDIIISRPGPRITASFLSTWVNSSFGKELVLRVQGGLAQQHFNVGEMKRLMVKVPPLGEQERVNSVIASVRLRIEEEAIAIEKLRTLRYGLRHDLLSGRVRVPLPAEATA